jgi:hypothetical protein
MAGRPHRPGDEGGFGLPVGGRSAGVGRGSIRGKNKAARKAAAKNTERAESKFQYHKDVREIGKKRASERHRTAKGATKKAVSKRVTQKVRRDRFLEKPPQEKRAAREAAKADVASGRGRSTGLGVSKRQARKTSDAYQGLKKARATERKVNRLADLSAHIAKRAGGGRRTHFLGDAPK